MALIRLLYTNSDADQLATMMVSREDSKHQAKGIPNKICEILNRSKSFHEALTVSTELPEKQTRKPTPINDRGTDMNAISSIMQCNLNKQITDHTHTARPACLASQAHSSASLLSSDQGVSMKNNDCKRNRR
jgi:hypothetical protein